MKLKFDEKGLIPAIIQDAKTKKILSLAYMNKESLEISINEGKTCFYSRSRQELWRKGETSGNYQHIVKIYADCDQDALVVEVIKDGPACHTGEESCFFEHIFSNKKLEEKEFSYEALYSLIEGRKTDIKEGSYTSYLFEKGIEKILKKIGEESTEVVIAGMKKEREEIIYEISDLAYHIMVLMVETGISLEEISLELSKRHIVDHKIKQASMR